MSDPDVYRRLAALERWRDDMASIEVSPVLRGTYTPTYQGGTTGGITTYNGGAAGQVGSYVLIGKLCLFTARADWTSATGTGEARVSLPFTAAAYNYAVSVVPSAVTYSQDYLVGQIIASTNYVNFRSPISNVASAIVNVEAAGVLTVTGVYQVA